MNPAPSTPWWTPTPGPITVLTPTDQVRDLVRTLRTIAAHHDDTAWLHPRPGGERRPIPSLSQDLLDAIGVVGLARPRSAGETHLLRPLTHLVHGPTRHLIVDDATLLPTYVLTELHQTALIAGVQLWLIIDTADQPSVRGTGRTRGQRVTDLLEWVADTATVLDADELACQWANRPTRTPNCEPRPHAWWHTPLAANAVLPACDDHQLADPSTTANISCLLAHLRRALTGGTVAVTTARQRLIELSDHADTTVADRWALTVAARDIYTPGMDALTQTAPNATRSTLADIAPDGTTITHQGGIVDVSPMRRPALARLHTSRRLAGCLSGEPIDGIFDSEPGTPTTRGARS